MIYLAGEPDDIWWDGPVSEVYLGADLVWKSGPTVDVYDVSVIGAKGANTFHPLINLTPPPGETWEITLEGTVTEAGRFAYEQPRFRIGNLDTDSFPVGQVRLSGQITSTARQIGVVSPFNPNQAVGFAGTVTVTYPN